MLTTLSTHLSLDTTSQFCLQAVILPGVLSLATFIAKDMSKPELMTASIDNRDRHEPQVPQIRKRKRLTFLSLIIGCSFPSILGAVTSSWTSPLARARAARVSPSFLVSGVPATVVLSLGLEGPSLAAASPVSARPLCLVRTPKLQNFRNLEKEHNKLRKMTKISTPLYYPSLDP